MKKLKVKVKIYEIIEKEGISLREMGRRIDITHPNLIKLGKGKREGVEFNTLIKIAQEFNISDIREIIDFEEIEETDA